MHMRAVHEHLVVASHLPIRIDRLGSVIILALYYYAIKYVPLNVFVEVIGGSFSDKRRCS